MKASLRLITISCVVLIALSSSAWANLVVNGGFETHDLTGWTSTGDTTHIYVCGVADTYACNAINGFQVTGAPHSGDNAVAFGPTPFGTLSQTLATVAGQHYDLSLWVENCPDDSSCEPNSLGLSWDGILFGSAANIVPSPWVHAPISNLLATSASTVLSFSGENSPSFFLFDDISVQVSSAVPEPLSISLLGVALGSLVVGVRATRQK